MTGLIIIGTIYTVWMIWLLIYQSRINFFETRKTTPVSKFSIVISFKNEAEYLPRLLHSLKNLNYPLQHFEIIAVDDHSVDESFEIVNRYKNIKVVKNSGNGKKRALQTGITMALNEWIVTLDADCELQQDYLQTLNGFIVENQPEMILGPVRYFDTKSFIEQFQQFEFLCLQALTMASYASEKPFLANGANLIFKKKSFEAVGGHEGNLSIASGDDVFLLQKFTQQFPGKIKFLKSRSAIVKTQAAPNWKSLIQQKIRWASKSKKSGQTIAKLLGILMMLVHLSLLYALFNFKEFYWFIVVKFLVDALCLSQTNRFYRARLLWWYYPLSFIVYPFYLLIVFVLAFRGKYQWKGQTFKT